MDSCNSPSDIADMIGDMLEKGEMVHFNQFLFYPQSSSDVKFRHLKQRLSVLGKKRTGVFVKQSPAVLFVEIMTLTRHKNRFVLLHTNEIFRFTDRLTGV